MGWLRIHGYSLKQRAGSMGLLSCLGIRMARVPPYSFLSFILGGYVGKLSGENPHKTGLKYAILAAIGAITAHLVGDLLRNLLIKPTNGTL